MEHSGHDSSAALHAQAPAGSSATISRERWQEILTLAVQAEFEPSYRRRHRRYPIWGEAKASGEIDGEPFKHTWTVMEVSAEGLTVKTSNDIQVGIPVHVLVNIHGEPLPMRCRTMHCTQTLGGYKLGQLIEFDE